MSGMDSETQIDQQINSYAQKIAKEHHIELAEEPIGYYGLLSNKLLLVHAIREGLPFKIFSLIKEMAPFSMDQWAAFLGVSTKSIQRYESGNQSFKPLQTEKIMEIAEITKEGLEVFDDMKQFNDWLQAKNFVLGNMKPIDLLHDSFGQQMVLDELHRIDEGVFA